MKQMVVLLVLCVFQFLSFVAVGQEKPKEDLNALFTGIRVWREEKLLGHMF